MTGRRALLTLDLPPRQDGGIATLADVLATGMAELNEPVVVYARGRGEDVDGWDQTRPYPVSRMWGHSWVHHTSRNVTPHLLSMYVKHRPPGLLLASWQFSAAAGALFGPLGVPVTTVVHGREITSRDRLPPGLDRVDRVLVLTGWLAGELRARGLADDRIVQVAPGIHLPTTAGDPAGLRRRLGLGDHPLVLCVGRLVPRKGQDSLIRAWPAVLEVVPAARLVLVGDGPDRARLAELIDGRGLGDRIRLAGFLPPDDLESSYRAADLFAMPCRDEAGGDTEGFGLVYLEAGARGLPVIGGRTAGVREAVADGQTGLLVEPGDVPALAAALTALLTDRDRARALGAAGRDRVRQQFTPAAFARRVLDAGAW
jgi:phosphatidyl-myo-inositol dimannoside synthase